MTARVRLGVNIDHVATVRNARGGSHPDPVRAARTALEAGADGITAHLREDRRHITDADIAALSRGCDQAGKPLNLEMAVTEEMLVAAGIRPSLFIEPSEDQVRASAAVGAQVVEFHTGRYCHLTADARPPELVRLAGAARLAASLGLEVHAGHGLDFATAAEVLVIPEIVELNIGHFLIGEAVFTGLDAAIRRMRGAMDAARS